MLRLIAIGFIMFAQYAIWGAWAPTAGKFFTDPAPVGLGLSSATVGWLLALIPLSSLFMPPLMGWVGDRVIARVKLLGLCYLLSAGCLFALSRVHTANLAFLWLGLHALVYAPTIGLCNAVVFGELPRERFTHVRVCGTIGWISAGIALAIWRKNTQFPVFGDQFLLGCGIALAAFVACMLVKNQEVTPLTPSPLRRAFRTFFTPPMLWFGLVVFLMSTQFEFYYSLASSYLGAPRLDGLRQVLPESYLARVGTGLGLSDSQIPLVMILGQAVEIPMMLFFPWLVKRVPLKWLMGIGAGVWCLQCAILAYLPNQPMVMFAMALHGCWFVLFTISAFVFADRALPDDLKASSQGMMSLVVVGLGRGVGAPLAGWVRQFFTSELPANVALPGVKEFRQSVTEAPTLVDWQGVFMIALFLSILFAACIPFLPKLGLDPNRESETDVT